MNTQWSDEQLQEVYAIAQARLNRLCIDIELVNDESGQTSPEEHLTWLATAADSDITEWAKDCKR